MKKSCAIIAAILSLCMLCACGAGQPAAADTTVPTQAPVSTSEPASPAPEVTEAPEASPEVTAAPEVTPAASEVDYGAAYSSVLTAYRDALAANAGEGDLMGAGLSILCIYAGEDKPACVGYCFADLDGDSMNELLIGQISGDEFTDKVIFDAYTLVDGAPVQLFQSRERARYYLCGDNTVALEGSSGADSSDSELYAVSGGALTAISGTPDSANYVRPEFTAFSNY